MRTHVRAALITRRTALFVILQAFAYSLQASATSTWQSRRKSWPLDISKSHSAKHNMSVRGASDLRVGLRKGHSCVAANSGQDQSTGIVCAWPRAWKISSTRGIPHEEATSSIAGIVPLSRCCLAIMLLVNDAHRSYLRRFVFQGDADSDIPL